MDAFIEVHIEQGGDLAQVDRPIGLARSVWPHGRWRLNITGESNHAGTAPIHDRRDPMLVAATAIQWARQIAHDGDVFATVGKLSVEPNSSNSVAHRVDLWLDLRASTDSILDEALGEWTASVQEAAITHRVQIDLICESRSKGVTFDVGLKLAISECYAGAPLPILSTAAGHDAAVLTTRMRAAMIFVRNQTGISHARDERATTEDCAVAVGLLTDTLKRLAVDKVDHPWAVES